VFLSEHDASDGLTTFCRPYHQVEETARYLYYGVKVLNSIRKMLPPVPP